MLSLSTLLRPSNSFETRVTFDKIEEFVHKFLSCHDVDAERKETMFDLVFFKEEVETGVRLSISGTGPYFIQFERMRGDGVKFIGLYKQFIKSLEQEEIIEKDPERKLDVRPEFECDSEENSDYFQGLVHMSVSDYYDVSEEYMPCLLRCLKKSLEKKRLFFDYFLWRKNEMCQMLSQLATHSNTTKRCILSIMQLMIDNEVTYKTDLLGMDAKEKINQLLETTTNERVKRYCRETLIRLE